MDNQIVSDEPVKVSKFFSFHGTGKTLFGISIVNVLLSIITLGLYYPWAKAAIMRYNYSETEFLGSRFVFHGTGKEMFFGLMKAILVIGVVVLLVLSCQYLGVPFLIPIFYLAFIVLILPFAIVGSLRYRASRSSWRGIHFSYNGSVKSMAKVILRGVFFTLITFGIYGAWFTIDVIDEVSENLHWGNIRFKFTGEGGDYFWINFGGIFLSYITLGIYSFKFMSNRHNFMVNNTRMIQGQNKGTFVAHTTGMKFFKLIMGNLLIIVFTLGIGFAWAIVRHLNFLAENTEVRGRIDFDGLEQGEVNVGNATGEGFFDAMDFELI